MPEAAVLVEGLSKTYRSYDSPWHRLRDAVTRRSTHREFAALSEVSFSVAPGQGFGLIGENGAGKSTLLEILAGVSAASTGSARVRGKVSAILELGSGFHPEFTGRQNVALNAAMLGLNERELRERMPQIIDFSELGSFIDQPLKTYSTGMAMRLGFAIATQVDPEVLIIDEALSVGDGYFQKKCMDRLQELVGEGRTLLFCSHAMYYISAFCDRALWLRNGRVEALGPAREVVARYEEFLTRKSSVATAATVGARSAPVRITDVTVRGGDMGATFAPGDNLAVDVQWAGDPGARCHVSIGVNREDGIEICSFSTHVDGEPARSGDNGSVTLEIPSLPLVKGAFSLYVFLGDESGLHVYDQHIVPQAFRVESPRYAFGLVALEHRWREAVSTTVNQG